MQIFYDIESAKIVFFTYGKWETPGEYSTPNRACIQCDCDPAFYPVSVASLGEPTPIVVEEVDGNVYLNAVVNFEPTPAPGTALLEGV